MAPAASLRRLLLVAALLSCMALPARANRLGSYLTWVWSPHKEGHHDSDPAAAGMVATSPEVAPAPGPVAMGPEAQEPAMAPGPAGAAAFMPETCPPPGFDALKEFNITEYISAPWYIQQQVPLIYQPASQLYCVKATYTPLDASDPLKGVVVRNYGNDGEVNGPVTGTSGGNGPTLTATVPDPSRPAKLQVGFTLPGTTEQLAPGPYWIIAAGANPTSRTGSYDWAIVIGGPPIVKGELGCKAGTGMEVNGSGLWLFSRLPQDPDNTELMRGKLQELGLDPSELLEVEQEGCTYQGSR